MDGQVIANMLSSWLAIGLVLALVVGVICWRMLTLRPQGMGPDLSDIFAISIEAGQVVAASTAARQRGARIGASLDTVLGRLLGPVPEDAADRLDTLLRGGREGMVAFTDPAGHHWAVDTMPSGARMRVILREMPGMQREESPPAPAEPVDSALSALAASGTAIFWQRGGDSGALWSSGTVATRAGDVGDEEALRLLNTQPVRSRPGAETRRLRLDIPRTQMREGVSLAAVEVPGPDGTLYGMAVDATATAMAERTLGRFVQTMTETFAHLAVGLAIFDQNRSLALFNPALAEMWQADPAWLARRPSWREILEHLRSARRIPDVVEFRSFRDRLLALFDDPDQARMEELWDLSDGSSIRVMARPHPHGSIALLFDDVTERLRLEQKNRQIQDLVRSTLDRLDEALAVFTPNGLLQFVNPAFHDIWGTDVSTAGATVHIRDICEICSRQSVETEIWSRLQVFVTAAEDRRAWTARITLGSGRVLWGRVAPLPDGSTMVAFADITDSARIAMALKERNEALETAEEMRVAVLDNMSHRLKTPLNTVMGYAKLLADPDIGSLGPRQQDYADGIIEAAGNLLDTIGDVTELAALEIDPPDAPSDRIPAGELMATVANLLDRRAAEARIVLGLAEGTGEVRARLADGARLRQIVFNLAADAIHRCPPSGRVILSAVALDPRSIRLRVSQSVPADEDRPVERAEGSSLAIPLLRRMLAREGGRLSTSFDDERRELRFTFVLTVKEEDSAVTALFLAKAETPKAEPVDLPQPEAPNGDASGQTPRSDTMKSEHKTSNGS